MRRTGVRPEYAGAAWACPRWRRIDTNSTKSITLTEVREENIMKRRASVFAFFLLVAIGAANQYAQAANLSVNCDKHESISKVLRLLAKTNPLGPNKVTVSGSCDENLVIRSMDRLTLITKKGASITDRSGGNSVVVDVEDSHSVTVQGFTINGGNGAVLCNTASVCYLTGNTIQDGVGNGVFVSGGSNAFLESNVIQNNGGRGSTTRFVLRRRLPGGQLHWHQPAGRRSCSTLSFPASLLQMTIQRAETQTSTPAKLAASHAATHKLRH